jgi:hypothetical protein
MLSLALLVLTNVCANGSLLRPGGANDSNNERRHALVGRQHPKMTVEG